MKRWTWPIVTASAIALLVAGCSSSHPKVPLETITYATTTTAAPRDTPTPTSSTPTAYRDDLACNDITSNDYLKSVTGYLLAANVVKPGDVTPVMTALQADAAEASPDLAAAINQVVTVLQAIDDAVSGSDSSSAANAAPSDLSTVTAAIHTFCAEHHHAVPSDPYTN